MSKTRRASLLRGGARDLRHSFINVAHDLGVNESFVSLLVGHALTGVHASYLTRLVVGGGLGLWAAQRAISRRIVGLLWG